MRPGLGHTRPSNYKFHHMPILIHNKHLSMKVKERIK